MFHVVQADILGIPTTDTELSIRAERNGSEVLVLGGVLRRFPVILQSASLDVISAFQETFDVSGFDVPHKDLTAESSADEFILDGWVEVTRYYFGGVLQSFE